MPARPCAAAVMAATRDVARAGLLEHDSVAQEARSGALTVPAAHLELSGAIDILWQLKDPRGSDEVHLDIHEESKRFMSDFFDRVRACKDSMLPIRESINTIKQLHAKIITEVSQTKSKEYSKKLDALLSETSRKARDVKDQLKALEVENAVYEEKFGRNSAEFKIHLNMHGTVTKKFIELMHEYETTQGKYKSLLKERVARQVKVANPNATEQEVAEAVENGGANVFVDQVLSKADQVAMNAYADVQSKHQDLMRLEASIKEVHQVEIVCPPVSCSQEPRCVAVTVTDSVNGRLLTLFQLFQDMALMVEAQGELLDNIEEMVSRCPRLP